eukprot:Phypoly_transcript_12785.p1 GENE.Phypoly_transcript_12785~~Phypoly_transcript_12785.p1  ORF type:complete len:153 (+),score=31.32 Phypoly_transcript_12785:141-599(+)
MRITLFLTSTTQPTPQRTWRPSPTLSTSLLSKYVPQQPTTPARVPKIKSKISKNNSLNNNKPSKKRTSSSHISTLLNTKEEQLKHCNNIIDTHLIGFPFEDVIESPTLTQVNSLQSPSPRTTPVSHTPLLQQAPLFSAPITTIMLSALSSHH